MLPGRSGDLVIVRQQPVAENDEIVAALVSGAGADEATVKTLQRLDDQVWLILYNPGYQPIPADEVVILGKMVAVVRTTRPASGRRRIT